MPLRLLTLFTAAWYHFPFWVVPCRLRHALEYSHQGQDDDAAKVANADASARWIALSVLHTHACHRHLQILTLRTSRGPSICLEYDVFFLGPAFIKGPEGPEPALGFFEKKPGLSQKDLESHVDMSLAASKTTKVFAQRARGSRERFFRFTLLLLR